MLFGGVYNLFLLFFKFQRNDLENIKLRKIISKMLRTVSLEINHLDFSIQMFFGEKKRKGKKKGSGGGGGGGGGRGRKRNMNITVERGVGQFHINPVNGNEIPVLVVPSKPTENERRRRKVSPRLERIMNRSGGR